MKHIVKRAEPEEFLEWKSLANEDWKPSYNELSGKEKKAVLKSLKEEQGFICCYCERELNENDYHIEHHNPQERGEIDPLDFSNMICSCQKQLKKGEPRHCGNSKGNWFNEDLFVSPLNPKCESRFKYTGNGEIEVVDNKDIAASTTIEKLQLNIDKLIDMRKKAIAPFLDDTIEDEEFIDLVNGYLKSKEENNGRYNEFYTTIKSLFPLNG